jgi:predicted lipoprotein
MERMTSSKQETVDVQQEHQQTIVDHVENRVASESQIEEALDRELTEVVDDPDGRAAVQNLHDMVKQHRDALVMMPEEDGTTV